MTIFEKPKFWILPICIFIQISCSQRDQSNWLQFRGEGAKGIAPENANPVTDFTIDKNVLWKIETPEGYSSPIIFKDNLILTGVNRDEKNYILLNINKYDGSIKWLKRIEVDTLESVHSVSSPAAATPASDGEYIYCFFPSLGLICYDFAGNKIWERSVQFYPALMGSGTSPIVYKDKVVLNHDNLVKPKLLIFSKKNGQLLWEKQFPILPIFKSASWSTPVIWNNQVILHRLNKIEGFDLNTGKSEWQFEIGTTGCATPVVAGDTLFVNAWMVRGEKSLIAGVDDFKKLFEEIDKNQDGNLTREEVKEKYPDGIVFYGRTLEGQDIGSGSIRLSWGKLKNFDTNNNNLLSELEWKEFLELMNDYSNHGLTAIHLGDTGNITISSQIWKVSQNIPEVPSVIVKQGLVYMVKNGGIITCVNSSSGEIIYVEKLKAPGSYLSSPLYANGLLYIPAFNGKITVIKEGKEFKIINQMDLEEKIGASPVALEDILFVRTDSHLYAFKSK